MYNSHTQPLYLILLMLSCVTTKYWIRSHCWCTLLFPILNTSNIFIGIGLAGITITTCMYAQSMNMMKCKHNDEFTIACTRYNMITTSIACNDAVHHIHWYYKLYLCNANKHNAISVFIKNAKNQLNYQSNMHASVGDNTKFRWYFENIAKMV